LDQQRAVLRATDEGVADAVADLRPSLSYALKTSTSSGLQDLAETFTLSASWEIYTFGRNKLGVDIAKENVLATRAALVEVEQQVILSAISAYMDVRSETESVGLQENSVRLITEQLRAARDRFEVGEITRTDVALAESALAAARAQLAQAQGRLDVAREAYRVAIGHYPGVLSTPPALPRTASSLEAARNVALKTHPTMKRVEHQVNVAELGVIATDTNKLPTLSGAASNTSALDSDSSSSTSLSLTLSGSIYAGGSIDSAYRSAVARRDQARAGLHIARHSVGQNVGLAWSQLKVANATLQATDRQIEASQVAYDGVREEASLGARTTLDVLDAEQDLLDARASRISAVSGRYTATYQVLSSMGLLTADHLNLGINTYDPAAYYNAVKDAPNTKSDQGRALDRIMKSIGQDQ
jgi:outer membrane protein